MRVFIVQIHKQVTTCNFTMVIKTLITLMSVSVVDNVPLLLLVFISALLYSPSGPAEGAETSGRIIQSSLDLY